jgi:hypothetical protein
MKSFFYFCALFSMLTAFAQSPAPFHFDECIDLMAVVWRLSGSREYNLCNFPQYAQEVDAFFAPCKEHQAVQLACRYQQESSIGYDAVVSFGFHLLLTDDGTLVFNDCFAEDGDISFDRWSPQQKKEFLEALNDFYRLSHFHDWYLRQQELYEKARKHSATSTRKWTMAGSATTSARPVAVPRSASCSACWWEATITAAMPS